MTQLATTAPADTDRTTEIAALNDAARAGSLVTSRTVFTRALADILAGEDPDPGTRQLNLMMGQHALRRLINETPIDPGNDPHGERDFGVVVGHLNNIRKTKRQGQGCDKGFAPRQRYDLTRPARLDIVNSHIEAAL